MTFLTRRKKLLMMSLVLSWAAPISTRAETAEAPAVKLDTSRCSHEYAPYFRDSQAEATKRLCPKGLYFKQGTDRHLLFASSFGNPKRSTVVQRDSGKTVATLAFQDVAIVEDGDGKLLGTLALEELKPSQRRLQLYTPQGEARWKVPPVLEEFGDSASVLVAGELLIVAHFHRIATGSSLTAFDLATGTLRWRADVQQLQIAHSKYWNDVGVTRAGNTLSLRGLEAGGCHLQTFDLATGRRLSSQLHQPR